MDFNNKKVLITGGCSGIGKIMARKSLERGASNLIIWDINEEGLAKTKEEFAKFGKEISTYKVDVSNLDEIKIAAQRVRTEVGNLKQSEEMIPHLKQLTSLRKRLYRKHAPLHLQASHH